MKDNLINYDKDYVVRINLKTDAEKNGGSREDLISFCLDNPQEQYIAIGWSCVYPTNENGELVTGIINNYNDYYDAVYEHQKQRKSRLRGAHNVFLDARKNDLFWTRDLNGEYWICRAKNSAQKQYNKKLDVGAVIPVEAYKFGLEVPGQIKVAFNRPNGGISERIYDKTIIEFSKYVFNSKTCKDHKYSVAILKGDLLDNLSPFDLEELVISYIQIKYDYYVLSGSIANKSTTIAIECEFRSKNKENPQKAVVQVKGGKNITLNFSDYKEFADNYYTVFLYAPKYNENYISRNGNIIRINKTELRNFYDEYKAILPDSIIRWENLFEEITD